MSMTGRNKQDRPPADTAAGEDAQVRPMLLFAALLVALVGACVLISVGVLHFAVRDDGSEPQPGTTGAASLSRPQQDVQALLRGKQEILQSYGWQDRRSGVVRIPVARALELAVERGLKTFASEEARP